MLQRLILLVVVLCFFVCSCAVPLEEQMEQQKDVIKFKDLFSNTFSQNGYLGGIGGGKSSITKALVNGRYVVVLKFDVHKVRGEYKQKSEIKVNVWEYNDKLNDGTPSIFGSGMIGTLTEAEWDTVDSIDRIFQLIGVDQIKDKPFSELATWPPVRW